MNQFAQLRDHVTEFEKRETQLLVVLPEEPAHIRFWLKRQGFEPEQSECPVLADPSYTVSATYGVALQGFRWDANWPVTFVVDQEGLIRFRGDLDGNGDRPAVKQLLEIIDGWEGK